MDLLCSSSIFNSLLLFMLMQELVNFWNKLNYAPTSNIPDVMTFCNYLGDQSSKTDFSYSQ